MFQAPLIKNPLAHAARAAFCLFLSIWTPAGAATEICGTMKKSADWIPEKSPYIITGDIRVLFTARLTIHRGTTVKFRTGGQCPETFQPQDWSDSTYPGILIEGAFYVRGTEAEPVIFEPEEPENGAIRWDGIRIYGKELDLVNIEGAVFRGANHALQIKNSNFKILHCIFEENNTGIKLTEGCNVRIMNNNFIGNRSCGISISASSPLIMSNIFSRNRSYGIWSDSRQDMQITHNAFWDNRDQDCFKCPLNVMEITQTNKNSDSCDKYFNIISDPVFIGTPSHEAAMKNDLGLNTPISEVKDTIIARMEHEYQEKFMKKKELYKPLGTGKYILSVYSRLIDAGHPKKAFNDRDGSPNDIGIHGGPFGTDD